MQLHIVFKGKAFVLSVGDNDTIATIKSSLESLTDIPAENQKLLYKGVLSNSSTVAECRLSETTKIILMGSKPESINKVQQPPEPMQEDTVMAEERWEDETKHQKIIATGCVSGCPAGNNGSWPLPNNREITHLRNSFGNKCRMIFAYDSVRISSDHGSLSIPYSEILSVSWQKLEKHQGYGILLFNTVGQSCSKYMYLYFVPLQYMDAIKNEVVMKQLFG